MPGEAYWFPFLDRAAAEGTGLMYDDE
jgi:hypothetical protein